jgi:hypothetical protein
LPNDTDKLSRKYSHTDPPFGWTAALFLLKAESNTCWLICQA